MLIDKYYDGTLSLEEARELQSLVERDVHALRRTGTNMDDLALMVLFSSALRGFITLRASA